MLTLCFAFLITGCEEVIDVNLQTAAPRLVIDASIDWVKGTAGNEQHVRLTTTAGFYEDTVPVVSDAVVFITDADGNVFNFTETPGTGDYVCTDFNAVRNAAYTLTVVSAGQTYTATENLVPVTDIGEIVQTDEGGFFGDEIEVKFYYQDPPEENYYVVRFDADVLPYADFEAYSDEFFNGNQTFEFFSHEDLKAGDVVEIRLMGVTRRYQEYMAKLLLMAGSNQGPFGTAPATVRGNIVNTTTPSDYALGYFRLAEVDTVSYTVQ